MGLGEIFTRDIKVAQSDTVSGATRLDTIVIGPGGAYPSWDTSGGPYRGALQVAAAWRASMLIAELLGRLPWDNYRKAPDATADDPPELLTTPPVLEQPAPPDTRMVTFSSWGLDALFHGNALGIYADRDRLGYPTAITPVPAEHVWIKRRERTDHIPLPIPIGAPAYYVGPYPYYADTTSTANTGKWYSADQIFHVKGPCAPGALRGMGVLEAGLGGGSLSLAMTLQEQAGNVAGAGVPTMHIKSYDPDFDEGDAAALKSKAIETQRVRSPMVTNALVDATPLAWNPSETQLIDARKLSLVDIANMFGLDAEWVNAGQVSGTYQNVESKGIDFLRHGAGGWLARFEQTLSQLRPRGQWVEANRNAELQADTLNRYQVYELAVRNGILTRDEVRALERRKPLTPKQRAEALPTNVDSHEPAGPPGGNDTATGVPGGPPRANAPQGSRQPGARGRQGPSRGAPGGRLAVARSEHGQHEHGQHGHDSAGERIGDRWS